MFLIKRDLEVYIFNTQEHNNGIKKIMHKQNDLYIYTHILPFKSFGSFFNFLKKLKLLFQKDALN